MAESGRAPPDIDDTNNSYVVTMSAMWQLSFSSTLQLSRFPSFTQAFDSCFRFRSLPMQKAGFLSVPTWPGFFPTNATCTPRRPDQRTTRRAVKGKEKVEIDVEPKVLSALAAGPDRNHRKKNNDRKMSTEKLRWCMGLVSNKKRVQLHQSKEGVFESMFDNAWGKGTWW